MSPLPLNELRVGLCPDRLIIARFRRGLLRRRLVAHEVRPVNADPVGELWQLAAGSRLSVILSNHFVRYAVLPWSATLVSEREWSAFALHSFVTTYGEVARTWDIRVCTAGRQKPAVACAVDRGLIESLRRIPGLVSIEPHVMAAFNARRTALPGASLWFVLQERGRVTLSLIFKGKWRFIRNRQAASGWQEALADLLDREAAGCADARTDCVMVCSEDPAPEHAGRYRLLDHALPRNADPALRQITMALGA